MKLNILYESWLDKNPMPNPRVDPMGYGRWHSQARLQMKTHCPTCGNPLDLTLLRKCAACDKAMCYECRRVFRGKAVCKKCWQQLTTGRITV